MLVNNMALELLLPQHDQLANTERICGKLVHMGVRAASDKKGDNIDNMRIIIINGVTRVVKWRPAWVCAHTVMRLNGTVRTDTRGSRSRMTCKSVCARARACVESYVRACAVTV